MQDPDERNACGDPAFERSLIPPDGLAKWRGSPIGWVESTPHGVEADLLTESNRLVMTDCGATRAEFLYGRRSLAYEFKPGSIGFFAAGTELKHSRWRWQLTRRIFVDLNPVLWGDTGPLEPLRQLGRQTEIEFHDRELEAVLRSMAHEAAAGCPNGALYAESLSLGVAMRLQQREAERRSGSRERGKLTPAQLQRVRELINTAAGASISLSKLAAASGFSPAQFSRLFKNSLGCTPHQYVLRSRLEKARELVVSSSLTLAAIAGETGFASQSHMTRAFVHAFRTPPGEMRRDAMGQRSESADLHSLPPSDE